MMPAAVAINCSLTVTHRLTRPLKWGEAHLGIPQVMVDHLPIQPAAEGVHQGLGALKVVEGYQGLDTLFQQVVDELVVEGQTLGVGIA